MCICWIQFLIWYTLVFMDFFYYDQFSAHFFLHQEMLRSRALIESQSNDWTLKFWWNKYEEYVISFWSKKCVTEITSRIHTHTYTHGTSSTFLIIFIFHFKFHVLLFPFFRIFECIFQKSNLIPFYGLDALDRLWSFGVSGSVKHMLFVILSVTVDQ